ncbi:9680_t:CDS:2, partial [Funneliformis caledonium]
VVYRVDSFDDIRKLLGFAHITSSSGSCYDPPSHVYLVFLFIVSGGFFIPIIRRLRLTLAKMN